MHARCSALYFGSKDATEETSQPARTATIAAGAHWDARMTWPANPTQGMVRALAKPCPAL